jgi:hypothetical protein
VLGGEGSILWGLVKRLYSFILIGDTSSFALARSETPPFLGTSSAIFAGPADCHAPIGRGSQWQTLLSEPGHYVGHVLCFCGVMRYN